MAIKHTLALDIPETACENIIRIWDASVYGAGLAVDCPRLDIYLPGFALPIYYIPDALAIPPKTLNPGFVKNFSTADLGITANDQPAGIFPDGLYTIKYSVSPNETVFVECYHVKFDDATANAEYCNSPKQAVEMYNYAETLLSKYLTGCCVSCNV